MDVVARISRSSCAVAGTVFVVVAAGCPNDDAADDELSCDTETPSGAWDTSQLDWRDPGLPGNECLHDPAATTGEGFCPEGPENPCAEVDGLIAHHCFITAVHAIHMWTGELLVYHGFSDERVWPIGHEPDDVDWHPVPFFSSWEVWDSEEDEWDTVTGFPDLFCSGQVQLGNAVLVAGGNVNGSPTGGGLVDTFLFAPFDASAASDENPECPFGWRIEQQTEWTNLSPSMTYDRWYPTLTMLPDGRVLISGGDSRVASHDPIVRHEQSARLTRVLEVYDPTASPPRIDTLDNALFPVTEGVPEYPFMFVLPNGDVLYAGALASTTVDHYHGRILVLDYNHENYANEHDPDLFVWADLQIDSEIAGGSAVMYRPGRIMKSGGVTSPTNAHSVDTTEIVDLSDWPNTVPDEFLGPDDPGGPARMINPRHYHTLTLLPDGRVLATGGNTFDNGQTGESPAYPFEYDNISIEDYDCAGDGCPSVCVNVFNPYPQDFSCGTTGETLRCSLLSTVICDCSTITVENGGEERCEEQALCDWDAGTCVSNGFACDDLLDVPNSAICSGTRCRLDCETENELCGMIQEIDGQCPTESRAAPGGCDPANNAYYAVHAAEIWDPDPDCLGWTELGEQTYPRMYHSSALLLRDGRVLSMGGGHRQALAEQPIGEYFQPEYESLLTAGPEFSLGMPDAYDDAFAEPGHIPHAAWFDDIPVVVDGDEPTSASLMRLGSATHGFDMDQRLLRLRVEGEGSQFQVLGNAPQEGAIPVSPENAPPGNYMLFLNRGREPGTAQYIHIGDEIPVAYVCEASESFEAEETSCTAEPESGVCPGGGITTTPVDPPMVEGPLGPVSGFRVLVPAGLVRDPEHPTPSELTEIEALCAYACTEHFAAELGQAANCGEPGAFETPAFHEPDTLTLDLLAASNRHGEGLFFEQAVACDLNRDCYTAFDESVRVAVPSRVTPSSSVSGVGQEFLLGVEGEMEADSSFASGPVAASIAGTVGYSECVGGSSEAACPFYLGSLELELVEPLVMVLDCTGGPETYSLDELTIRLVQPAFGIAEEGTDWKAFPPGNLIFEAEGALNETPFSVRRPNQEPVYVYGSEGWIQLHGINGSWIETELPCGEGQADLLASWGFDAVSWPGEPPWISIDVPSSVSCPDEVELDHTKWDQESDIANLRWLVDGVLLDAGMTSVDFTTGHTLTAIVRDDRGATKTVTKAVACE